MKVFFRLALRSVGVLAVLALLGVAAIYGLSEHRLGRAYELPLLSLTHRQDAATIEQGRHLVASRACNHCHGEDLAGAVALDAGPLGTLNAPSLRPGGAIDRYDIAHFEHALRHAVAAEGRGLLLMPSTDYSGMADGDVEAIYAYLKQLPPVPRELPRDGLSLIGRTLLVMGKLPLFAADRIDHAAASRRIERPAVAATAEYGRYVAQVCEGCHGPTLSGGHVPGTPPQVKDAANLTSHETGLRDWTEADFLRAMREGKRPDGRELDPFMPWRAMGQMDETELAAVWAYLRSLPAKPAGNY